MVRASGIESHLFIEATPLAAFGVNYEIHPALIGELVLFSLGLALSTLRWVSGMTVTGYKPL